MKLCKQENPLILILTGAAYFFLIFPILIVVIASLSASEILVFPPQGFSLRWYGAMLKNDLFIAAFWVSVKVGFISTAVALVLGTAAAYTLTRYNIIGKEFFRNIIMSPIIVPAVLTSFALFSYFVAQAGFATYGVLLVGHIILLIPYVTRVVGAAFVHYNSALEDAARGLGASPLVTFVKITVPLILPGILSATLLAFIVSFNNVPFALFLTGPGMATLPLQMLYYLEHNFNPLIASISTFLLVMTVVFVFIVERIVGIKDFISKSY